MSFWERLFGSQDKSENLQNTDSCFDKYRSELNKLGLKSLNDLEELVKPIIRKSTKIELQKASNPPDDSQLISHFGGQPYFEKGEEWPKTKTGKPLEFIFQIYNKTELEIPDNIELIQFYYNWDESPWDTGDDGWLVKIYKRVSQDNTIKIEKPEVLEKSNYCEITFKAIESLPDWEGIDVFSNKASQLSCVLDENEPWESYDKIISKLIGKQDYQSQLGGYPTWAQGESTPLDSNENPVKLLFQIDSEDNAGLMWGDAGLIYIFYEEKNERIEFMLQCH